MTLTVNASAAGVWSTRVGTELELVGPGANDKHLIVKRPGERRTFGMPVAWLDGLDVPRANVQENHPFGHEAKPHVCPMCGQEVTP